MSLKSLSAFITESSQETIQLNEEKPFELQEKDERIDNLYKVNSQVLQSLDMYEQSDRSAKKAALKTLQYHLVKMNSVFKQYIQFEKTRNSQQIVESTEIIESSNDLDEIPFMLKKEGWISDEENPEVYDYSIVGNGLNVEDDDTRKLIKKYLQSKRFQVKEQGMILIVK